MFNRKNSKPAASSIALKSSSSEIIRAATETVGSGDALAAPNKEGVVVVGKGSRVSGAIGDCQVLDVYGVVEADVVTERLIVREGGGIRGNINADNAEISGVVEGALVAYEHLEINSTGEVWADVKYQTLAVAKGAVLKGSVWLDDPIDEPKPEAKADIELSSASFSSIGDEGQIGANGAEVAVNGHDLRQTK